MSKKYKLIIFDCDGTLVDTETIINKSFSEVMISMGYNEYTLEYCLENFTGFSYKGILEKLGATFSDVQVNEMHENFMLKVNTIMPEALETMPNAEDLLESLSEYKKCVASNGEPEVVRGSLKITGLLKFFSNDSIYTYKQVKNGKPAPDLFLFAAQNEGFKPNECLVIEDSLVGVNAAKAANMDVIALHPVGYDHKFNVIKDLRSLKPLAIIPNLLEVKKFL